MSGDLMSLDGTSATAGVDARPAPPLWLRAAAWGARHLAGAPGRWRVVRWLEGRDAALARYAPVTISLGEGVRMCVDLRDFDARPIFVRGFDPRDRLLRVFRQVLRPGDCMIDVGANLGFYTLAAARRVGPAGRVFAFEAAQRTYRRLKRNLLLSRARNVDARHCAVSDRGGSATLHGASDAHSGLASLRAAPAADGAAETVACVALDGLLNEIPATRLVKIDVEGAEFAVLRGMRGLLRRDKPFVIFELTDAFLRELGQSAAEVCAYLRDEGYSLFRLDADRLSAFDEAPLDQCNVLAAPADATAPAY